MSIVVSDTSPIRALVHLSLVRILPDLYGEVLIPSAVAVELANRTRLVPAIDAAGLPGVRIVTPSNRALVERFLTTLDIGESEALALALELDADLLLVDELDARKEADRRGLHYVGALGVLAEARQRRLIGPVAPLIAELRSGIGFHVSDRLRREVLLSLGEQP